VKIISNKYNIQKDKAMTKLICRLFVKNGDDINSPEVRRRYGTVVSIVAIIINIILFASKFTVGKFIALSIAITADAVNNLADAGSSIISLVSFKIASKPADREHPFGHTRMEYVTSMIVAFLVIHTSIDLVIDSVKSLISGGGGSEFKLSSVIVLGVAILLKLWLCIFNRTVGKKINSSIMMANAADSLSDCLSTAAVLVSTVLLYFFPQLPQIDAIVGVGVSVLIFVSGIKIFLSSMNSILGEAPDPEVIENIKKVIENYPEALGTHDMFIHSYGPGKSIVSLHIEVDGAADIFHSHDVIDNIEKELRDTYGYICTIHMDPIVTDDEKVSELRERVTELVRSIDASLRIHDFRFVEGKTHTNLIFDVAVPFEVKETDNAIVKTIEERVKEIDESYFAVITVDRE